jgi:photosystem II stability/assembly factor-like uncharacterized protein
MRRRSLLVELTTLLLLTCSLILPNGAYAASFFQWGTVSSLTNIGVFRSAISSDGAAILAGTNGSGVYLSTNSGNSFTKISTIPNGAYGVAMSANGTKMFAAHRDSAIVYASTDSGATWTSYANSVGTANNYAACMSGNGSVWMVGAYGGSVYTSTNNGSSWSTNSTLGVQNWWSCFISNDGTKRLTLPWTGALRYSSDSGATWSTSTTTVSDAYCLGSSDDGSKVIIGSRNGYYLYRSTNSGASFSVSLSAATTGNSPVYGCSSSGDGTRLVAVTNGSKVFVSTDSGATWSLESGTSLGDWYNVSMAFDGSRVFVGPTSNSYTSNLGYVLTPATFTLTSSAVNVLTRRSTSLITVQSNYAGKVTFYADGKRIPGCIGVATVSLNASCNYRPSISKTVKLTAKIVFTNSTLGQKDLELFTVNANPRRTLR